MKMHLIAPREVIEAVGVSDVGLDVYGLARESEGLIQVLSTRSSSGLFRKIGTLYRNVTDESRTVVLGEGIPHLELCPDIPLPQSVEVVSARKEMDSRRVDVLAGGTLEDTTVALIGAGSVGSGVGVLLAEAGVGTFLVLDRDHLDAANLSRHACDVADLGRHKAKATADLIQRRLVTATGIPGDVLEMDPGEMNKLLDGADLVVATTDSPACQFVVNEACLRTNTRALFAGAYERACGGEVILVRPGSGPCFFCAVGFRAGVGSLTPETPRQAYQAADAHQFTAEPGLGADIAYLSAVTAAYALAVLDPDRMRGNLLDQAFTLIHGGSTPRGEFADLFQDPFDLLHAQVSREDPCPVCGWQQSARREVMA